MRSEKEIREAIEVLERSAIVLTLTGNVGVEREISLAISFALKWILEEKGGEHFQGLKEGIKSDINKFEAKLEALKRKEH